ncbi:hypothetical protein B0H17DRAFT_1191177 [Mycena rosella]|uniref:Cytochrome c oxidase subunit 8, mitochondrial n=1 Tax=Mycena rosella TaxID=1033263 RepID=A0AAD7MB76_MYCRO|nr:hypothetical protein B0H17DRAFT_1191177 [Mycena rosella]
MSYRLASSALRLRLPGAQLGKRFASGHGEYQHFPFNAKQAETHPTKFAMKYSVFIATGFLIPFGAIYFRWNKKGGIKNP